MARNIDRAAPAAKAGGDGAPKATFPPYPGDSKHSAARCSGDTAIPKTGSCLSPDTLRQAVDNPFALLSAFRADDSPLDEVHLHPGILAVASMIADGCDSPGIEPHELEVLLRIAIYLDRLQRTPSGR